MEESGGVLHPAVAEYAEGEQGRVLGPVRVCAQHLASREHHERHGAGHRPRSRRCSCPIQNARSVTPVMVIRLQDEPERPWSG